MGISPAAEVLTSFLMNPLGRRNPRLEYCLSANANWPRTE
jgi:hypothetical protein